ncbi:MAG TPA: 16S rRNA (cytosine(1402)-N(4))-methyltransferase RsmH [Chitinophagaceae bacterium]|nr:16S rRNA (cytosine(1402)-N(4))-methyltransferase RsmH [Chitinophagaceae bacterium]
MQEGIYHVPVMLQEVIAGLQIDPSGIYVDCTFGGGGHSRAILRHLNENGRLIAFDQDPDARENLPEDKRVTFIPHNFRHLQRFLRLYKISYVNGVLADLGVSGHQIDEASRGFSTRFDAGLDMRMNPSQPADAAWIIQSYPEEKLHRLFEQYGEVTNAKTLAKCIIEARRTTPLKTINEFRQALYPVVKGNPEKYFAQVFQALRIEVNDELNALKEMLIQIPDILTSKGRVVIITFHSLEDRMVKSFFKNESFDEERAPDLFGKPREKKLRIITKKPIRPSPLELQENPRSRSAKLRIAERV